MFRKLLATLILVIGVASAQDGSWFIDYAEDLMGAGIEFECSGETVYEQAAIEMACYSVSPGDNYMGVIDSFINDAQENGYTLLYRDTGEYGNVLQGEAAVRGQSGLTYMISQTHNPQTERGFYVVAYGY